MIRQNVFFWTKSLNEAARIFSNVSSAENARGVVQWLLQRLGDRGSSSPKFCRE